MSTSVSALRGARKWIFGQKGTTATATAIPYKQNIITSLCGWQYITYFTVIPDDPESRHRLTIARRHFSSSGPAADWKLVTFADPVEIREDGSSGVLIGICEVNETIHVAYDRCGSERDFLLQRRRM
ncbi:hypothetical protein WAI453_006947 [Rhynchosporium graminicola]